MNNFTPDRVRIELSRSEFELLLHALGVATAHYPDREAMLRLVNRINEGNPNWRPYDIPAGHPKEGR